MKLSFIEVSGFRGFKESAKFEVPAGFCVLTGRNGVGKSTAFDAVEFALTGTISKFSVREAKGGGLHDHLWWVGEGRPAAHYVKVGFVDEDGTQYTITRTREGGLETSIDDLATRLCGGLGRNADWASTLVQTTLIRDETIAAFSLDMPEQARFNAVKAAIGGLSGTDPTKRIQAIIAAAESALDNQKRRVSQAEAEVGRALTALTEAQSTAARQSDIETANFILRSLAPGLSANDVGAADSLRRLISNRKRSIAQLQQAFTRAQELFSPQKRIQIEIQPLQLAVDTAMSGVKEHEIVVSERERLLNAERETDRFAEHLVALLHHGEALGLQEGHCPLCAAARSQDEFIAAIADARSRLSQRGERIGALVAEVESARSDLRDARARLEEAEQALRAATSRLDLEGKAAEEIRTIYEQNSLAAPSEDLDTARKHILRIQEQSAQLEQALMILESSSAQEQVTAIQSRLGQLRKLLEDELAILESAQRAAESAKRMLDSARMLSNQILTEQFDTVLPLLKELYVRLRPHADWQEIELDFGGKVRASLNFTVGDGKNPQFLFSSGQRRAAGLAFLLAIHLSRPWCGFNTLLLDDPIQHIDDYRALNLVEVLAAIRQTGRQVVVAVEDPALADVLCRRLRSTTDEPGSRIDLHTLVSGSAGVATAQLMPRLPSNAMELAEAS